MTKYLDILKQYWGYDSFRPMQDEIITSIGQGYDTLGLMPTGGGKSITFQVPALAQEGLCLVITPLVALMKDQVEGLKKRGIKAMCIHSEMNRQDLIIALDNCIYGNYKFLYLSPERLQTDLLLNRLIHMPITMLAVDEAHCISQWGYDFRPSYLKIKQLRDLLPDTPLLALTATATPESSKDIMKQLAFREHANAFQKSFSRPNISYLVRGTEDKFNYILKALKKSSGSAIVYTRSRNKTKEIADFLTSEGISAAHFHAGLKQDIKDQVQQNWMQGNPRVIVATNAFGMGIDKPDVRLVIHADIPDSLEAYFQEAGRAGRDQKKAYAVLLYHPNDKGILKRKISDRFPKESFIRRVYQALCNAYGIGEGGGIYTTRTFNLYTFCKAFRFNTIQTLSALRLLKQAQYIDFNEEGNKRSSLHFIESRDKLYTRLSDSPEMEKLSVCLLRSYSGLFSSFVSIDEELIAKRTGLPKDRIYQTLVQLDKVGIVKYIPKTTDSYITLLTDRIPESELSLKEVYHKRKEEYQKRIDAVIQYFSSDLICRSRLLLAYFGERHSANCQACDICHRHKGSAKKKYIEQQYHTLIKRLEEKPLAITDIACNIDEDDTSLHQVLMYALEEGRVVLDKLTLKLNRDEST